MVHDKPIDLEYVFFCWHQEIIIYHKSSTIRMTCLLNKRFSKTTKNFKHRRFRVNPDVSRSHVSFVKKDHIKSKCLLRHKNHQKKSNPFLFSYLLRSGSFCLYYSQNMLLYKNRLGSPCKSK